MSTGSTSTMKTSSNSTQHSHRRRASTGEVFGKGLVPSSRRRQSSSCSSSSLSSSPTCVRASTSALSYNATTCAADSFDEAFKKGTVLPYFFDTAVKSFDFGDMALRSYYSAITGSSQILQLRQDDSQQQQQQPQHIQDDDDDDFQQQPQHFPRYGRSSTTSNTTMLTTIRRRRCKSLNDLRIHHDTNDEIEIERPRSVDSFDGDDENDDHDCCYGTTTPYDSALSSHNQQYHHHVPSVMTISCRLPSSSLLSSSSHDDHNNRLLLMNTEDQPSRSIQQHQHQHQQPQHYDYDEQKHDDHDDYDYDDVHESLTVPLTMVSNEENTNAKYNTSRTVNRRYMGSFFPHSRGQVNILLL